MGDVMFDRLVRLVCVDMYEQHHRADEFSMDEVNGWGKEKAEDLVRALIDELKKPTGEMAYAGRVALDWNGLDHIGIWSAMLDESLSEGERK